MTELVVTNEDLKRVCKRAISKAFVMLDTEFIRTRTLTPLLGLIQLNDGESVSIIDPTCINNLEPLKQLLLEPNCIKVLHSCSEDLEAFNTALNTVPSPLFDTQFAAQLCGLGNTIGYANLVSTLLDIQLDKGESRTDWLARPLSEKQLSYAANDVIYLYDVYLYLAKTLNAAQQHMVLQETELLITKKLAEYPSDYAYLLIKNNWKLSGTSLLTLKYLAKWRLERARAKNMALNFVIKESVMTDIAMALPTSKTALSKVSSVTPQEIRMTGDSVINIVKQSIEDATQSPDFIPAPVKRLTALTQYKPVMAKLNLIVEQISENTGIAKEILSSKKQLHQVLKFHWFHTNEYKVQGLTPDLMMGWRKPIFEPYLSKVNF